MNTTNIMTRDMLLASLTTKEQEYYEKLKIGAIRSWPIKDWSDFSLNPQREKDIRRRVLLNISEKVDSCCVSYICRYSKLSEPFIKELMFITSPLFSFDLYNEKYINITANFYSCIYNLRTMDEFNTYLDKQNPDEYYIDKLTNLVLRYTRTDDIDLINNRVDWNNIIHYQQTRKEFLKKYAQIKIGTGKPSSKILS